MHFPISIYSVQRLFAIACCTLALHAGATEAPFQTFSITLLQPGDMMEKRVPDIDAMAAYTSTLQTAIQQVAATVQPPASAGFIALAVKPGGQSNVWLDLQPPLPGEMAATIVTTIRKVPPFAVKEGIIVYALKVGFGGATEPKAFGPAPEEWKAAAAKQTGKLEVGKLVEIVWPD